VAKRELEKSVSGWRKGTGENLLRVEKGNWRNLLRGGKRELEKSVTGWKKRTKEICYGVEKETGKIC
jgi:hypothetical protein